MFDLFQNVFDRFKKNLENSPLEGSATGEMPSENQSQRWERYPRDPHQISPLSVLEHFARCVIISKYKDCSDFKIGGPTDFRLLSYD